ncbi:MAG: lamin tail domain-containing protein [Verrucomicrobiota bacterium]
MSVCSIHFLTRLLCGCLLSTTGLNAAGVAVINEFHAKPEDLHDLEEFVELHNPGDTDLDLSGWSLTDAVSFTMPPGTILASGGYLVVAMDTAAVQARFGVTALGPWTGKLNSTGEEIVLRNTSGTKMDSVNYKFGFPWPSRIDGEGSSAELLHPALENDKGSSWRASGTPRATAAVVTYVPTSATDWKYFKATTAPPSLWRTAAFDDSSWDGSQAPFGYGDPEITTPFGDMQQANGNPGYAGAYFRKSFTIAAGAIPTSLHLRLNVDDGCVVWINGVEVKRRNVAGGTLAYTAFATNNVEQAWEDITLPNADAYLVEGTNVVAVHVLNSRLASGDFFFNLKLENQEDAPTSELPTPGARNSVYIPLAQTPPQISNVTHAPQKPTSGQAVTVSANLADLDGMGTVTLEYQLVNPGSYVRLTDAAYQTGWVSMPMTDDGTAGDAVSGDGVYTAVVAGSLQTHRRLTRYRIRFADSLGNTSLAPFADDISSNFAWFTSNGVPAWQGALRPSVIAPGNPTAVQTYSSNTLTSVPVYTLIASSADVMNSQYNGSYNKVRFRGTFVADGVVLDNIEFRNRGQASTYNTGKNKWRFNFNPGYDFQAYDNAGDPYEETWGSFSANANAGPWVPLHKGSLGVEEATSLKLFQLAGVPSPSAHYYHFRVIRGSNEAPAAGTTVTDDISTSGAIDGQYAGDFWGTFLAIERIKGGFLDSRSLPDGNIYKIEGNNGDAENLAPGQPGDASDWISFSNASNVTQSEAWWRANMDMDAYYTFHAINRLVGNVDLRKGENHFFYHRVTTDNRWVPIPWDLDMMYLAKSHQGTTINGTFYPGVIDQHRSILEVPALAREYRNRAREILDLVGSDASVGGGQIGQLFDEFARIVSPSGTTDTLVNADAALWNLHPRAKGSVNSSTGLGDTSGQSNHRGNFFRPVFTDSRIGGTWTRQLGPPGFNGVPTHTDLVNYFVGYATNTFPAGPTWSFNNGDQRGYGYQTLVAESADAAIPAKPSLAFTGPAAFPVDRLTFSTSTYSGVNAYGSTQWRLAEVAAPGVAGFDGKWKYEVSGIWSSSSSGTTMEIPAQEVKTGKTYRVRVRYMDATGRASHWSAPIQFVVGNESARVAHYWNFNADVVTDALVPLTGVGGKITTVQGGTAAFLIGDGQNFDGANARYGSGAAKHLRVNNPIGAELVFKMPTTGFERTAVSVETRRSGSGAGTQTWSYTLDGTSFISLGNVTVPDVSGAAVVPAIGWDFKNIAGADNNPLFAVKVSFSAGAGSTGGNNRFDNLVLTGNPLPGSYGAWAETDFPANAYLDLSLTGMAADPDGDGRSNFQEFALHTSPMTGDLPKLNFAWSLDGAVRRPALAFERPVGVMGVRYELQASTSLASGEWQTVATMPAESNGVGDVEHCVFRDPSNDDSAPARFLRLKIAGAP